MRAVTIEQGRLKVVEVDLPQPADHEARIAVRRAGICGTDLQLLAGYADFSGIAGHEFVGVVELCPSAPQWEGRRVVAEINVGCGECDFCRRGVRAHCDRREVLGIRGRAGAFASHVTVPVANLHAVPEGVHDDHAVFAEPLAAAFEILEQVEIAPTMSIAVVGDGKLGLLVTMVLCGFAGQGSERPSVTVFGRYAGRGEMAESFGAQARRATEFGPRFDVVIDTTGTRDGLSDALRRVRPRGTLVLKSTHREPAPVDLERIVVDEIRLVGSRCGPFDRALQALAAGLEPKILVEAVYPLSRAVDAFEHAATRGALKVLLAPD